LGRHVKISGIPTDKAVEADRWSKRGRKVIVGNSRIVKGIIGLGMSCRFERHHALRVSELALRLFDDLQPLHAMGNTERIWLRAAALLHDIGKRQGPRRHHKVARDIILNSPELPFRWEERVIIASIARYHRGPLPHLRHNDFGGLEVDAQRRVAKLASLLRLADGLDKGRSSQVENVTCEVRRRCVLLWVMSRDLLAVDKVLRKAKLFERVFGKKIAVAVEIVPHGPDLCLDSTGDFAYAKAV